MIGHILRKIRIMIAMLLWPRHQREWEEDEDQRPSAEEM